MTDAEKLIVTGKLLYAGTIISSMLDLALVEEDEKSRDAIRRCVNVAHDIQDQLFDTLGER